MFSSACINFSGDGPTLLPRMERRRPVEWKGHRLWPHMEPLKGYLNILSLSSLFPERATELSLAGMLQGLAVPRASLVLEEWKRKLIEAAEYIGVCLVVKQTFHSKYWCFYVQVSELQGKGQIFCFCASVYRHAKTYFNKADFKGIKCLRAPW